MAGSIHGVAHAERIGEGSKDSLDDELEPLLAHYIIDAHTPPAGTPTQPVEAGYMANAWLRMKHESYDEVRHMLDVVGQTVKVWAS